MFVYQFDTLAGKLKLCTRLRRNLEYEHFAALVRVIVANSGPLGTQWRLLHRLLSC